MDVVMLFGITVFSVSWFFWARTDADQRLVRLFWAMMLGMSAGICVLGWIQRQFIVAP